MGKNPIFLPYTYTLSSSILHMQYYQRYELKIFKMWVKNKFVLWQPRFYNLLTEEKDKKFTFLKYSDFWKRFITVNLKKFSLYTIFRWYTVGKFYMVKFNYFSGRSRCFEILLIDHFVGDIRNKISLVIIKKFLYQCHPPYSSVSSHRVLHLQFLGSCNIHIIYLQVKAACLKVNFAMFYFCHSKNSSNIMSNIFNFLSI